MQIPLSIRAGGAFLALALTFVILLVVSVVNDGWMAPYQVTTRVLLILLAAILIGAFATVRKDQPASRTQVIALAAGLLLIVVSMLIPQVTVYVMAQYWLALYAGAALLCALILRRSTM